MNHGQRIFHADGPAYENASGKAGADRKGEAGLLRAGGAEGSQTEAAGSPGTPSDGAAV